MLGPGAQLLEHRSDPHEESILSSSRNELNRQGQPVPVEPAGQHDGGMPRQVEHHRVRIPGTSAHTGDPAVDLDRYTQVPGTVALLAASEGPLLPAARRIC